MYAADRQPQVTRDAPAQSPDNDSDDDPANGLMMKLASWKTLSVFGGLAPSSEDKSAQYRGITHLVPLGKRSGDPHAGLLRSFSARNLRRSRKPPHLPLFLRARLPQPSETPAPTDPPDFKLLAASGDNYGTAGLELARQNGRRRGSDEVAKRCYWPSADAADIDAERRPLVTGTLALLPLTVFGPQPTNQPPISLADRPLPSELESGSAPWCRALAKLTTWSNTG